MMINPLNPIDKIRKVEEKSKVDRAEKGEVSAKKDSVEISSEAKMRLEFDKAQTIASQSPDIRQDKINQIKKVIQDGQFDQTYLKNEVLEQVADKIADSFLGR